MKFMVQPGGTLQGCINVPGDKSISHRTAILGAIANGTSTVKNFLEAEDTLATMKAVQSLGAQTIQIAPGHWQIKGVGLHGLQAPKSIIDCGNSGTGMRLLSGLFAGQAFRSELTGDASLCKRPMQRIITPLLHMGASITSNEGKAPLIITGGELTAIHYELPMPSAQVKSCILLASLFATGETTIHEPIPTRDHLEKLLQVCGVSIHKQEEVIHCMPPEELNSFDIEVPNDISSAAFFMVGATLAKGSDLTLTNVGMNPTRTGIVSILKLMGANIETLNSRQVGEEIVADLRIQYAHLRGIEIPLALVPLAIDEFPALFIAFALAQGKTILHGASELRVKESDRIASMLRVLNGLGIETEDHPDGATIYGGTLSGGKVDACGDHRIAMASAMAALCAREMIEIDHCAEVATSFPEFVVLAKQVGLLIKSVGV